MKIKVLFASLAISLVLSTAAFAAGKTVAELAENAVSNNAVVSSSAIRDLRAMGSTGLNALFVRYADDIERFTKTGEADDKWKRIAAALDGVSMQKDDYTSHLFWYTDLEQAKRAAKDVKKSGTKPILTLRLLGNLNEEFSCANSRLFRAILYSNPAISKYLRDNYILHWKSVRPAPRITIDFGDGRKIERTITGNSIHYVIDTNGAVIDAIPGLYSPEMFLRYLTQAKNINTAVHLVPMPVDQENKALLKYHKESFNKIVADRKNVIDTTGVAMTETKTGSLAILAAPMAMAKAIVVDEYSILRVYDDFAKFEPSVHYDDWNKLARAYSVNNTLDANSIAMIRRQNSKTGLSEDDFKGLFTKLDSFIALDTTRNDFLFHTKLYEWLNDNRRTGSLDLESLNAMVYDQIFQTPNYDKWLGLYSSDVYTALDGNGIIK